MARRRFSPSYVVSRPVRRSPYDQTGTLKEQHRSKLFLASIRSQQKHKLRCAPRKSKPNGQFKRQLTDEQITDVLGLLAEGMHKTKIAAQTGLNWSTIYNIKGRYVIASDGSVERKRDPYDY
jgi:DNA-binding NarL/FixJ family response regulator